MAIIRKSKKLGPIRVTASKGGLSVSGGVKGARVSANTKGEMRRTLSVPGAGIYDTKKVGGGKKGKGSAEAHDRPAAWSLAESPRDVVATLIQSLPAEQQRAAYEGYRQDPADMLAAMRESLVGSGWGHENLEILMPAMKDYMGLWTTQ